MSTEPLTDKDLPQFAAYHRGLPHDDGVPRSACMVCRLLATLDAARAAQDVAGRETRTFTIGPGLAALEFLSDRYGHTVESDGEDNWARLGAIEEAMKAARLSHDRGADAENTTGHDWDDMLEDIIGLWGTGEPDKDDVLETLAEHRPLIEAALSVPAPTLPALDAETLAKALVKATANRPESRMAKAGPVTSTSAKPRDVSVVLVVRELVEAIISEYEALRDAV